MAGSTHRRRVSADAARRRLLLAAGGALLPPAGTVHAQAQTALRGVLVPYLSTRTLLAVHEPIRRHLQAHLGRPVEFFTARNMLLLARSVRAHEQPLALVPAHMARLAASDWGYSVLALPTEDSAIELIARRPSRLDTPATLRGRRIATADPLALATLVLQRWLRTQQLTEAVELVEIPLLNAALIALERGEVDVMLMASGQLRTIEDLEPRGIVTIANLGRTARPCWTAAPELPPAEAAAVRQALLTYTPADRPGAAGGASFIEATAQRLDAYEPYAAQLRRLLATAR